MIVAFLQNPWFKKTTRQTTIDAYRNNVDIHRRLLELSATGKALRRAFGDLYDEIIWDNANPRHGHTRDAMLPPDSIHMARTVALHDADVVLLFGRQARDGWETVLSFKDLDSIGIERTILHAPHPMARGSANEHLQDICMKVKKIYAEWPR